MTDTLEVPAIGARDGDHAVRYNGPPINDAGIRPDDYLVVRQCDPDPGQLVVVDADDDATVGRFQPGMKVHGLVVGMYRSFV